MTLLRTLRRDFVFFKKKQNFGDAFSRRNASSWSSSGQTDDESKYAWYLRGTYSRISDEKKTRKTAINDVFEFAIRKLLFVLPSR